MNSKIIIIEYKPFQVDIHTWVTTKDHFDKVTQEHFEEDEKANQFVDNMPSDYYVIDKRPDNTRSYWVNEFRKDRYAL